MNKIYLMNTAVSNVDYMEYGIIITIIFNERVLHSCSRYKLLSKFGSSCNCEMAVGKYLQKYQ